MKNIWGGEYTCLMSKKHTRKGMLKRHLHSPKCNTKEEDIQHTSQVDHTSSERHKKPQLFTTTSSNIHTIKLYALEMQISRLEILNYLNIPKQLNSLNVRDKENAAFAPILLSTVTLKKSQSVFT